MLRPEIEAIQELLEEEEDSKCKFTLFVSHSSCDVLLSDLFPSSDLSPSLTSSGCMQSLSHYLILLSKCQSGEDRGKSIAKATTLLERLVEVDSDRKERYRDILESLKDNQ